MAIKNIIFDLGGVIYDIRYENIADKFRSYGITDFEKLYSAIIPYTCCDCPRKNDFHKCQLRAQFMKLGILPVDSSAKDACQYDYLAAGINLMEWARKNLKEGIALEDWAMQLTEKARKGLNAS